MEDKSKKPSQKRRAIIQGSLAAPVVLTVASPSAHAMASLRCDEKPTSGSASFFSESESADNRLRRQVDVVKLSKGESAKQTTEWLYFDPGYQDYVTITAPYTPQKIGPLMQGWKKAAEQKRWALVWVDRKTGLPYPNVQIQQPADSTNPTGSCWLSMNPGAGK